MPFRRWVRAFEKRCMRPFVGILRSGLRRITRGGGRIGRLERRVDELERLLRETAGLAYMRLDQAEAGSASRRREPSRDAA